MKYFASLILLFVLILDPQIGRSQSFVSKQAQVRIYSSTPLEDIEAKTSTGAIVLNTTNDKVIARIIIKTLKFKRKLMEEHFNENYMESDKYPNAEFQGVLNKSVDLTKDGEYKLVAKGKLTIHGVSQDREIPITFIVKNGVIEGLSNFDVRCKDHNIEIPKLVTKNIAEAISITIKASLALSKSEK